MKKNKAAFSCMALVAVAALAASGALAFKKGPADIFAGFETGHANNARERFVPDRMIVKYKGEKGFRTISVAQGQVETKVKEYKKLADVDYAEPDYTAYALMTPNDPYYVYQWNLKTATDGGINMPQAWDVTAGSNSVIVAVVDTGIAYETYGKFCKAPDLANTKFAAGYNFVNNTAHANDDNGHGTHVAGTIAQSTNNSLGVAGVAFNTALMPVKVLNSAGSGSYSAVANGIIWAVDHGAKVINMSLGGSEDSATIKNAVKYAYDNGVTVVAACGNESASSCGYPAAYTDYVISVGATQYDKTLAPYSSYGANLNIVAPGGNTGVDQNGDGYGDGILQQTIAGTSKTCTFGYYFYQGTSMAAPHVAGAAALLLAKGNATTPDQVRTAIESKALDLGTPGRDDTFGYGLLDAAAALSWAAVPECAIDADCDDGSSCTVDSCDLVLKACVHEAIADGGACVGGGGICCSGACKAGAASCAVVCWDGANQYLYPLAAQAKKFCKCAQGIYSYKKYATAVGKKTVFSYVSTANDDNWAVASKSNNTSVSSVTCGDSKAYLTNKTYSR